MYQDLIFQLFKNHIVLTKREITEALLTVEHEVKELLAQDKIRIIAEEREEIYTIVHDTKYGKMIPSERELVTAFYHTLM